MTHLVPQYRGERTFVFRNRRQSGENNNLPIGHDERVCFTRFHDHGLRNDTDVAALPRQ